MTFRLHDRKWIRGIIEPTILNTCSVNLSPEETMKHCCPNIFSISVSRFGIFLSMFSFLEIFLSMFSFLEIFLSMFSFLEIFVSMFFFLEIFISMFSFVEISLSMFFFCTKKQKKPKCFPTNSKTS